MLSSIGFYNMRMHNDIWELLSPSGMPGEYERQAIQQAPMISGRGYYQVGGSKIYPHPLLFTFEANKEYFVTDQNPLHWPSE
jgi:hypothetical protein